jgi:hypothetical protein
LKRLYLHSPPYGCELDPYRCVVIGSRYLAGGLYLAVSLRHSVK